MTSFYSSFVRSRSWQFLWPADVLKWKQTTFLPLVCDSGIILGTTNADSISMPTVQKATVKIMRAVLTARVERMPFLERSTGEQIGLKVA